MLPSSLKGWLGVFERGPSSNKYFLMAKRRATEPIGNPLKHKSASKRRVSCHREPPRVQNSRLLDRGSLLVCHKAPRLPKNQQRCQICSFLSRRVVSGRGQLGVPVLCTKSDFSQIAFNILSLHTLYRHDYPRPSRRSVLQSGLSTAKYTRSLIRRGILVILD